jgi:hypothetical protein
VDTPFDPAMIKGLRMFDSNCKLKASVLGMLTSTLSSDEVAKLKREFAAIDTDGSGSITVTTMTTTRDDLNTHHHTHRNDLGGRAARGHVEAARRRGDN